MAGLLSKEQELRGAGFTEAEIDQWRLNKIEEAKSAGFSSADIQKSMGIPGDPDMSKTREHIQHSLGTAEVKNLGDAFKSGFGMSATGLSIRKPKYEEVGSDFDMLSRITYNLGQLTGDLPWMVAGAALGGVAGIETGPGAVITAGGGAFALPAGMRATLIDGYMKGTFQGPGDFASRATGILWETAKGEAVGMATAGAGIGAKAILPKGASAAMKLGAPTAAELTTMVAVSRALEGELPTYQDFTDGAVLFAGFKGAHVVSKKMMEAYNSGNIKPEQILRDSQADVTVKQDVADETTIVPGRYRENVNLSRRSFVTGVTGLALKGVPGIDLAKEFSEPPIEPKEGSIFIHNSFALVHFEDIAKKLMDSGVLMFKTRAGKLLEKFEDIENIVDGNFVTPSELQLGVDRFIQNRLAERGYTPVDSSSAVDILLKAKYPLEKAGEGAGGAGGGGEPPKGGSTYEHGDEGTPRANAAGAAESEKSIKDKMGKKPAEETSGITWARLYQEIKDRAHPLKVIVDEINRRLGRNLPLERDPYVLMRMLAGNSGKFKQVVEHNLYDTDTFQNIGPGFETRIGPVAKDLDRFQVYMLARRAQEKLARGEDTAGITKEQAKAVVEEHEEKVNGVYLGGEPSIFKQVYESLMDFQEKVAHQYLVKSGILSTRKVAELLEKAKDFVPLDQPVEELTLGKPVTRVVRPIESILRNTHLYITMGEKNRAALALLEGMETVMRYESGRSNVPDLEPVGTEDVKVRRKTGLPAVLTGAPGEPNLIEQVESPKDLPTTLKDVEKKYGREFAEALQPLVEVLNLGKGDRIAVFRDGQRISLKVAPEVAEVYHGMDAQSMSALWKILSAPASMLRAGVALLPEYALRNIIVDQPMATILSKSGYIPFLSALRSITHIWSKDEVYQRWLKSGGANVALVAVDDRYIESKFLKWGQDTGWFGRVWNSVDATYREEGPLKGTAVNVANGLHGLFTPLRVMSQMSDTLTRLGEMRLADSGEGKRGAIEGGFDSREVTQDFLRMGLKMKAFNWITAFANSQLEGMDRAARAFKDRPMATLFKTTAMLTLPSVALWIANRDEQWYKDQPAYIRDNYWLFKHGDHIYKIRKPFEMGVLFGSGVERALDKMYDGNDEAFKGFANSLASAIIPNTIPTIAQPVLEHMTNHSFFNDRPLVSSSLEKLLPEYQYTPYTSETAKAISQAVGFVPNLKRGKLESLPPVVLENYVREWSGGMGIYALQIADQALIKSNVVQDPVRPAKTVEEYPVIKAFMVRYPTANTLPIQDFYEHYDSAVAKFTTMRTMARRGDVGAVISLSNIQEDMVRLQGIHAALGNSNQMLQRINAMKDVSPEEKRQLMEATYFQMVEVGRAGQQAVHTINKQLKGIKETVQ